MAHLRKSVQWCTAITKSVVARARQTTKGRMFRLIAQMPGTIPAGSVNSDLVDVTDFLPTMLEAAGVEAPVGYLIDGTSFYPQLEG